MQEKAEGPDDGSSSFGTIFGLGAAGAGLYGAYYFGQQGMRAHFVEMLTKYEANKLGASRKNDFLKRYPDEKSTCDLLEKIASQTNKNTSAPQPQLIIKEPPTEQQITDEVVEYVNWLFDGPSRTFGTEYITLETLTASRFQSSIQEACRAKHIAATENVTTNDANKLLEARNSDLTSEKDELERQLAESKEEVKELESRVVELESQIASKQLEDKSQTPAPAPPKPAPPKAISPATYLNWVHSTKNTNFSPETGLVYHTTAFRKELLDSFKKSDAEQIWQPLLVKCQAFEQANGLELLQKTNVKDIVALVAPSRKRTEIVQAYFKKALAIQPDLVTVTVNSNNKFDSMTIADWLQLLCSIIDDIETARQNVF